MYNAYAPYRSLTYYNGLLYGTTSGGGQGNAGIIFSIGTDGSNPQDIFDFNYTAVSNNGVNPYCTRLQYNGVFFGTTSKGESNGVGNVFAVEDGTGYTDLVDFNGASGSPTDYTNAEGDSPYGS